ncbi:TraB/GumN family protein [Aurantibacter sp.]|uniref:TraB/GumN family protein n=1 Tax=Aurantibacter sp. TaxID=2807103 RepID=UPI0035C858FF
MRHILSAISFLSFFIAISQNNQNSLLWEITGNGLEKPSYLYGTMHVSSKIAFRLDDVFFEALNNSEYVALESDPSDWLGFNFDNFLLSPQNYNTAFKEGFYDNIVGIETPKDILIRSAIRFNNQLVNGILYRKNSSSDNFEEETYLDMFIYQAGKKTNKPIVSLESIEESRYLVSKAQKNSKKDKIAPWLSKLYEKESAYVLREKTYRDRNIQLLDSISEASNTSFFRDNMLTIRNKNMVTVLDTLMRNKSVFSGVGAAHLGGKKGMIEMLREKGYNLKPLVSPKTDVAKTEKERIENTIKKPSFTKNSTPDGFLSLNTFGKLREFVHRGMKYYISPDLSNGAHLSVSRINTYNYLPNDKNLTLKNIDNYLFEDIPGEIITKETLSETYPGISVLNKTKKGDYEKYHIYQTPLEFIIIKLSGRKNYVLDFEKNVFNSIKFKEKASKLITLKEPNNKYTFSFPETYSSDNFENAGNKTLQAKYNNATYFLKEAVYFDTYYIEEDNFEAKYLATNFFENLELENFTGNYTSKAYKSFEAEVVLDSTISKNLHLKTIVKDGSYYVLGYVGTKKDDAISFFNSLKFNKINYPENFKTIIDTSLHFSVSTNTKTKPPRSSNGFNKKKPYLQFTNKTNYYSNSNEQVYVEKHKYHDLQMYANIDSLWNETDQFYKNYGDSDGYKNFKITGKIKTEKDSVFSYTFNLQDSISSKQIKIKQILNKGALFELRTLTDSIISPSKFITEFYNSFSPIDSTLGVSVFKDKTNLFFEALKNNDSIVFDARNKILFSNKHVPKMISFLEEFEFPENKKDLKYFILESLGELNHPDITPYFKKLYKASYSDPDVQLEILNSVFDKNTEKANQLLLELLREDLPLDEREIGYVFNNYKDSLITRKSLFPDLLDYTSVTEYKENIYELLSRLRIKNLIKPKVYKKYKKQIINDAKIEIKRSLSNNSDSFKGSYTLIDYVYLIFPYRKEIAAKSFFNKLIESKNGHAQASYYMLLAKAKETIPQSLKVKTVNNKDVKYLVYRKLVAKDLFKAMKATGISQKSYIKSYIFSDVDIEKERDSIVFVGVKPFTTDLEAEGEVHFYKVVKTTANKSTTKLHYFGYLKPENEESIVINPYIESDSYGDYFDENKDEEGIYNEILKQAIHKTRKRLMDDE